MEYHMCAHNAPEIYSCMQCICNLLSNGNPLHEDIKDSFIPSSLGIFWLFLFWDCYERGFCEHSYKYFLVGVCSHFPMAGTAGL